MAPLVRSRALPVWIHHRELVKNTFDSRYSNTTMMDIQECRQRCLDIPHTCGVPKSRAKYFFGTDVVYTRTGRYSIADDVVIDRCCFSQELE